MKIKKLNEKLKKMSNGKVAARITENGCVSVFGELDSWDDIIAVCKAAVDKKRYRGVLNDVTFTGGEIPKMRLPLFSDDALDKSEVDVLVIGGGISGASIARELMRYDLSVLLVEKESDVAMQASGRNDGEVHPGVDLHKGQLKLKYLLEGNKMYDKVCEELDVPFKWRGQYVCIGNKLKFLRPVFELYAAKKRKIGITDTKIVGKKELYQAEPNISQDMAFAMYNERAGVVCPYGLTIAYAENAVDNGAKISLNTAVTSMEVKNKKIISVMTTRGRVYPKVVVNAAGVFAEEVAKMANDRFYSIHPRRGTNSILDKKANYIVSKITTTYQASHAAKNTKGGGVIRTVDNNVLVGPDAVETFEKENFETTPSSVNYVFNRQKDVSSDLNKGQIITYFTGVRAATFEEDYVVSKGIDCKNIVHAAGIQSPGLTSAPAVAVAVAKMAVEELSESKKVSLNGNFNPKRTGIPRLNELSDEKRNELIKQNPDYGVIVCRCEEISRGEIIDALNRPLKVATVDGIKKRVRVGMGRCQGGFCTPQVLKLIAEHEKIDESEVTYKGGASKILLAKVKERAYE